MKPKLFIFILGIIAGVLGAVLLPPLVQNWLPEGMRGGESATAGVVVAKRLENDRLLLTIESADGAVLATFKQKVPEIDLLIDTGDKVTLGITTYEPFVEDPKILGVKKGKEDMLGAAEGENAAGAKGAADQSPESSMETEGGEKPEAGNGSEDMTLPPMGPHLEDKQQSPPPAGDDGKGAGTG